MSYYLKVVPVYKATQPLYFMVKYRWFAVSIYRKDHKCVYLSQALILHRIFVS